MIVFLRRMMPITLSHRPLTFARPQDILRQSYVHHSLRPGIFSRPVLVIVMRDCGTCSPKLRPTYYPVTRAGYSASNGKLWRGNWPQEDTMVTYVSPAWLFLSGERLISIGLLSFDVAISHVPPYSILSLHPHM